jgi:glycerophosphoryl diester phosphodiesterase
MTLVIAHRGASRAERENTLPAFRAAVALGAEGVELDVRRSADGVLVVHHDPMLGDGRPVCATGAAELPEHVPTLAAVLDACAGAFVNIEIKNDPDEPDFDTTEWLARTVCATLAGRARGAAGEHARWLISSFRIETVNTCRALLPAVRTAWLVMDLDAAVIAESAAAGHAAVHPHVETLDRDGVRAAHAAGLAVNTWTCDDPDQMATMIAWGVDGLCTNVPDVALEVRARASAGG